MRIRILAFSFLLLAVIVMPGNLAGVSAQENSTAAERTVPDMEKITGIAPYYTLAGDFSKFYFVGEDNRTRHWLDVWKTKKSSSANVINYIMQPDKVITWGRGPILEDAFNHQCLPSTRPNFEEKDYWVALANGLELKFVALEKGEELDTVKAIFSNLQAAATQQRAGGLLDTPNRTNVWESNVMNRFQKGKRKWINPAWVQPITVCIVQPRT